MSGLNRQFRGIVYIAVAAALYSLQDAVIKWLSPNYPLHEIVLIRSTIASLIIGCLIYWEGGISILATSRPGLHLARTLLVLVTNSCFYLAIAAMPLAEAIAIFFVAPPFYYRTLCLVTQGICRISPVAWGSLRDDRCIDCTAPRTQ